MSAPATSQTSVIRMNPPVFYFAAAFILIFGREGGIAGDFQVSAEWLCTLDCVDLDGAPGATREIVYPGRLHRAKGLGECSVMHGPHHGPKVGRTCVQRGRASVHRDHGLDDLATVESVGISRQPRLTDAFDTGDLVGFRFEQVSAGAIGVKLEGNSIPN